jgi:hypothetical protein
MDINRLIAKLQARNGAATRALSVAAIFGVIGILVIQSSSAATLVANSEAEAGTIAGLASLASDANASNGSSVVFGQQSTGGTGTWPTTPPAQICGNASVLGQGPASAPVGAIVVPAGDNSSVNFQQTGKTFWFASGIHTLGTDPYSQIMPGNDSRYVGAPGAIIDGQKKNQYAFTQQATNVTIEYLTIRNFGPVGSNNNEGVVNHDAATGWTIQYTTINGNAGAGMMIGSNNTVRYNCVTNNEQYGFNAYNPSDPTGIVMDHNEISYNDTYDWEAKIDGCGCTGGGKFWKSKDVQVTNNYVHHNHSVGLWADNNNRGFLFEGNYITDNQSQAIFYETSYNALIKNNYFGHNAIPGGASNPGFPTGAIYLSESGSDSRVATAYNTSFDVTGNRFEDNWGGVVLWENADRYCNSPANTSTGECTLVNTSVATITSCNATNIANAPYYNDCRWKTQNVQVYNNTFESTAANISASCTFNNHCGISALISNYGTYPAWSPYTGTKVQTAITYNQNNKFYNNTYKGDWRFVPFETGSFKTLAQWQATPYSQDTGSTLN